MFKIAYLCSVEVHDQVGEGVVWDDRLNCFWWCDIKGRKLHRLDWPSRFLKTFNTPHRMGSFALTNRDGVLVAAFEQGFARFQPDDGALDWLFRPLLPPGVRFNDGRVDRRGRFWAGTMVEDADRAGGNNRGQLYRLEGDDAVATLAGIQISNGLCWSPDGATMYFADSPKQTISAYDFSSGEPTAPKLLTSTDGSGFPDGSCVDSAGNVWNARWDAGVVVVSAPNSLEIERLAVPANRPSCCALGGTNLSVLAVTSAWDDYDAAARAEDPEGGNLFLYETSVKGLPECRVDLG